MAGGCCAGQHGYRACPSLQKVSCIVLHWIDLEKEERPNKKRQTMRLFYHVGQCSQTSALNFLGIFFSFPFSFWLPSKESKFRWSYGFGFNGDG